MPAEPLVVNRAPAVEDVQFLQERLYEHNVAQTGYDDGEWLSFFIRDGHQRIQAGMYGATWGGCCYIRYLWTHEDGRGQGYGTRLMHAAEHAAQSRGGLPSWSSQLLSKEAVTIGARIWGDVMIAVSKSQRL